MKYRTSILLKTSKLQIPIIFDHPTHLSEGIICRPKIKLYRTILLLLGDYFFIFRNVDNALIVESVNESNQRRRNFYKSVHFTPFLFKYFFSKFWAVILTNWFVCKV